MRRAIRLTGEFCLAAGVVFALLFWAIGRPFIGVLTSNEDVRTLEGLETRVNGSSMILLPAMAGGC